MPSAEGVTNPTVIVLREYKLVGHKQNSAIYISLIVHGGVADSHSGLNRGDLLLSVNGVRSVNTMITFYTITMFQIMLLTEVFSYS